MYGAVRSFKEVRCLNNNRMIYNNFAATRLDSSSSSLPRNHSAAKISPSNERSYSSSINPHLVRTRNQSRHNIRKEPILEMAVVDEKASSPDASTQASETKVDPELEARIQSVLSVGEECVSEQELRNLLAKKPNFVLYDGFEPSGRMHIAQGVFKSINVNKCTAAGGTFKFWVADWFALMNDKMGGDLEKIRDVGKYLVEVWKASGMHMENVEFIWTSESIEQHAEAYWEQVLDISRVSNLTRIKKCGMIMGRKEDGNLSAAQILYPVMQCADIFHLKADICQLGVDQRKVNALARDYCGAVGRKLKPIILSHHMLLGLAKGQAKMSKSNPDSAVFMEDSPEDVRRKIMAAYCPREAEDAEVEDEGADKMQLVEDKLKNPIIDYIRYIVFCDPHAAPLVINGKTYADASAVQDDYVAGVMTEEQLKESLIDRLNEKLVGVRQRFQENEEARQLLELVDQHKKDVQAEKDSGVVKATPLRCNRKVFSEGELVKKLGVICAPSPCMDTYLVSMEMVLTTLSGISLALKTCERVVVWCEDWSSFVLQQYSGDKKAIKAFYGVLEESIKLLLPQESLSKVEFKMQSQEILKESNQYWISAIDVGRKWNLGKIREALGQDVALTESGQVVATLMRVADILGLCYGRNGVVQLYAVSNTSMSMNIAATEYISELDADPEKLIVPTNVDHLAVEAKKAEGEEEVKNTKMGLVIGEADNFVGTKVKKVYCREGDIMNNDCLRMLKQLVDCGLMTEGSDDFFVIERKEEHGGNMNFKNAAEVTESFADKELHPDDLKKSILRVIKAQLAALYGKGQPQEWKNHVKVLDMFGKKMAKKK